MNNFLITLIIFFTLVLIGCGNNKQDEDAKNELLAVKNQVLAEQEKNKQPLFMAPKSEKYDAAVRNNATNNSASNINSDIASSPLENLQFTGTIINDNEHIAYIRAPNGLFYQVKVGDRIGNKNALVQKVELDSVAVLQGNTIINMTLKGG